MSAPRLERVRELFVAALELPPERRRALLDDACAGDPLLRGEVEDLLALDAAPPEANGIAQGAGADWLAADLADHAPEHEPPPARIGRFQI
ncbi:MAG: hypothetical protein K2Q20_09525, partial [Phycisphaerales bacterium]|nr:hypothetical protein [Phycisphaerales bacterium]